MDLLTLYLFGGTALFFIVAGLIAYRGDLAAWNGGTCPECGRPWRRFSRDQESPRGYSCDRCDNVIWVSFQVETIAQEKSNESSEPHEVIPEAVRTATEEPSI